MKISAPFILFLSCLAAHGAPNCGDCVHKHLVDPGEGDGNWFHFHPFASVAMAVGGSTSEKNIGLIGGAHAPIDDGFNLQGIELGAVFGFGPHVSVHANYNTFWDRFDHWDGEWEDAFVQVDLPAGFSVRGGQFLAPFGHENTLHLHSRAFVDPPISVVRLLGEEGLFVQGGELAYIIPGVGDRTTFRFGYGQGREHEHGSVREERVELYREATEHEEGEEHDDEEEEEHAHSHGFAGNGGIYDVEEAYLDDGFFFARLDSEFEGVPFLNRAGVSLAAGQNGFGRATWVLGADFFGEFDIATRPAWWRAELFHRHVDAYDSAGLPGHFNESGFYAAAGCEIYENWSIATRAEWASGDRTSGQERRWRFSTNLTHVANLHEYADLHTRLEYSFDDLGGYGTEHTVWLQWVLNLGSGHHGHAH